MKRRVFLFNWLAWGLAARWGAGWQGDGMESAATVLSRAVEQGQVRAAALFVRQGDREFARAFGECASTDDLFLVASISKPMSAAAVMTLYDSGELGLDDPVVRFIPEFRDGARSRVTIRQLLTHVSGLPDHVPENPALRKRHAELSEFVAEAVRTPLQFAPGARYSYSSMGILLAAEVARRIRGKDFREFVAETVFRPLRMNRSAMGLGRFGLADTMRCQVEDAAPESGAGDPTASDWDWNSRYWRELGAPWGGAHASAADVARFLAEFLHPTDRVLKAETARLMIRNHNPPGVSPRGLGFVVGAKAGSPECSEKTFGHGGATGTLAWADPLSDTVCVVLTTLPAGAAQPHPRRLASDRVATAVR